MAFSENATTSPPSPYLQVVPARSCPPKLGDSCTSSGSLESPLDANQLEQLLEAIPQAAAGSSEPKGQAVAPPNTPESSSSNRTGPTVPLPRDPGAYANQPAEIMPVPVPAAAISQPPADGQARNPSNSPRLHSSQPVTMNQLKELLLAVLDEKLESFTGTVNGPAGPDTGGEHGKHIRWIRASKLEYKIVNEVWDPRAYRYTIVDRVPAPDVSELDEWIFVVRNRVDRRSHETTTFIDIKSPVLQDILRVILKNIGMAGLEADKPAVEQGLLYHFLSEMRDYATFDEGHKHDGVCHLNLLVQYLESVYQPTAERLSSLIAHRKITYDLLWALFKPGTLVYLECPSTGLPRCIRFTYGVETKTYRKQDCFEIHGQYFDDDGVLFGECEEVIQIEVFRGARRIESLPAYPLKLHADQNVWSRLVSNGRKFIALRGSHHRQYRGQMFVPVKEDLLKIVLESTSFDRIRGNGIDPHKMKEEDLVRCSPTVLGFCLNKKFWGEFAVDTVEEIKFSTSLFDMLEIPEDKKRVVKFLAESRVTEAKRTNEDDIIAGKGQGVIMLLHGPPGVGKTLTAEAIAEDLQCPLYSISSGQLSSDAETLESQLGDIFDAAAAWKAILLLDEADVYLQRRNGLQLERNRLVATFLRTLEYYGGIFFLTTNLIEEFDEAVLDRVHLKLRYGNLNWPARRKIFDHFLKGAKADIEETDLRTFAEISLDGRQIKNIVKVARNVSSGEGVQLSAAHVRMALRANGYSIPAQRSLEFDHSLYED
ncbi:uncharacterized protein CDV56_106140 [Aspergillus thermomutatus]|uniref:AAA+ ATPase domain-containing protein n=1 Tax=Aspergillus thermomutatus TaxID=41047 RepID=A0A397GF47_ASPTH|nr:uncharacterized protein CDV56_106140 [Aspergillus thermomutatus]RHZ48759.1 hypothetical protein CDV56_106140 [Aspergillus thermomutatus]